MALAQADVNRIVQATIAKATEINLEISVAVCDSGGHLLAFNRTQGAIWISAPVAQGKAGAASAFGRPSGSVPSDSPVMQTIVASQGGRILPAQGGLPLFREG